MADDQRAAYSQSPNSKQYRLDLQKKSFNSPGLMDRRSMRVQINNMSTTDSSYGVESSNQNPHNDLAWIRARG